MWLRHSHSLHHQSAFVVFICLPSDTDSIPHPSACATPLSKCLADSEGGWGAFHIKSVSHSYLQICRKMLCSDPLPQTTPCLEKPGLGTRLARGVCGVHSFAAYPHVHPFSHPLCRSSSLSATAVEARLAHE